MRELIINYWSNENNKNFKTLNFHEFGVFDMIEFTNCYDISSISWIFKVSKGKFTNFKVIKLIRMNEIKMNQIKNSLVLNSLNEKDKNKLIDRK